MTHFENNRRAALCALACAAPFVLLGCSALGGAPRPVMLSQQRLSDRLTAQFPYRNRYLDLVDVELRSPQLRLLPETNRLGTQLEFEMGSALLGEKPVLGRMDLTYGLRFQGSDGTVRMTDVRLESLDLPKVAPHMARRLNGVGGLLVEGLLQNLVVYQVKPDDLESASRAGYQPGPITVLKEGVQMALQPVAAQ